MIVIIVLGIFVGLMAYKDFNKEKEQRQETQKPAQDVNISLNGTSFCMYTCEKLKSSTPSFPPYNYEGHEIVDDTYLDCICREHKYRMLIDEVFAEMIKPVTEHSSINIQKIT